MLMEDLLSIQIESKSECLADVEKLVDNVCDSYKISQDHYGNILIAITEAVNNAIVHGNKQDPTKRIAVRFIPGMTKIQFVVEDEGDGFDYDSLPDPTDPENIEKPNGRGVYLMKHLADEVVFQDNGRKVELGFHLSAN